MHTQVLGVTGTAVLALALLPGVAAAHSARVVALAQPAAHAPSSGSSISADLAALNAYEHYLAALAGDESSSAARAGLIVSGVENNCSDALADLSDLSSSQLEQSALTDFGDEVDADLDIAYMAPTKPAVKQLAAALEAIEWPTTAQARTITKLVSAERALVSATPSNICADATTLDAAPLSEPTATLKFLKRYRAESNSLRTALSGFQSLLSKYETTSEEKLIGSINSTVSSFSGQSSETEQTDATTVLSELGVTSASTS